MEMLFVLFLFHRSKARQCLRCWMPVPRPNNAPRQPYAKTGVFSKLFDITAQLRLRDSSRVIGHRAAGSSLAALNLVAQVLQAGYVSHSQLQVEKVHDVSAY